MTTQNLKRVYDWMRIPDNAEEFTQKDLIEWTNDRPIVTLLNAQMDCERQDALISELVAALEEIKSNAESTIRFYENNGPQWTTPQGNEYVDQSSVLDSEQEVIDLVSPLITKAREQK
jgi:uncharacterized membrane-anchored protein YjiN (DUF445 family)